MLYESSIRLKSLIVFIIVLYVTYYPSSSATKAEEIFSMTWLSFAVVTIVSVRLSPTVTHYLELMRSRQHWFGLFSKKLMQLRI